MSKELLDLTTIVDRPTVRITSKLHPAGKLYEILVPSELSLYQGAVIEKRGKTVSEIDLEKQPTPAQERAHRKALDDITKMVCPSLEPKVLTALSPLQLLAIYGAFAGLIEQSDGGDRGNARRARTSGA